MQLLNGYKSGGGLLFLGDGREIERDNLWGIRLLLAFVIANAAVQSPADAGEWLLGLLVVLAAVYWLAVRLFSRPETDQSDGTTDGVRT